ncbi:cation:proton antiporter [Nitrospira sp. MA-1]|nr:cation:proton antiporter [Nitrospira sp. MA-1]
MYEVHALEPILILLSVGIFAITLMQRIGLSSIVGYLIAGMLIGPYSIGLIHESETTKLLADLGVVFLLFDIGLHFSLSSIWEARRDILGLGPLQIVLCGLAFGAIAMAMGLGPEYAVILGGAFALSSTAVVVQTLGERGQQTCPVGLTGTAVLIFQDIFAIFLLIFAASLEIGGSTTTESGLAIIVFLAVLKAVVAFIVAVVMGRYAVKPLFRFLATTKNEEIFTATALLVVLATAVATGGAGLSLTLGAFLGGMIISETPYRHVIQTEAKPFRHLLLGFFFITVGMSLNWRILIGHWAEILIFLFALIAIKALLVSAAARVFGWSTPGSVQLGFLLAQGSELTFVIIAMPMVRESLGEGLVGVVITGIATSLVLTPTLATLGNRLARILRQRIPDSMSSDALLSSATTTPLLVFGMGDVGRMVVGALEAHNLPYDAIEMDHDRFLAASADGYSMAFGDPSDVRLMGTLAFAQRETLVVTIIRYEVAKALMPIMRDRYPNLTRFIAVDTEEDKTRFEAVGMRPIVNRSFPRGIDIAAAVLRNQHVDEANIQTWMQRVQERALQAAADLEESRTVAVTP